VQLLNVDGPRCKQGSSYPYSGTPTPAASHPFAIIDHDCVCPKYAIVLLRIVIVIVKNINAVKENIYSSLLYYSLYKLTKSWKYSPLPPKILLDLWAESCRRNGERITFSSPVKNIAFLKGTLK
jgi:hypothetical protein